MVSLEILLEYIKKREHEERNVLEEMRESQAFTKEELEQQRTRWISYYEILDYIKEV